jgi:hypothetical protein
VVRLRSILDSTLPTGRRWTPTSARCAPSTISPRTSSLFARALPRDFVDVRGLLKRFTAAELVTAAAAKDRGFNVDALADALGVLPMIRRERFDLSERFGNERGVGG